MDLSFFDAVTTWLGHHQMWLGPVIALVSCVESLVAVGIVVPGVAMLFGLGAIAGTGIMPVWGMLAWAFIGAVIGDGVSYWLGYRYHAGLKKWWPFNRHPQWLGHGEKFFYEYGAFSVVIGRFVGAVRPFIPVVAGMMDMPPVKFYTINILSALIWAPVYLLPGYFAGAAMTMDEQLPGQLWTLSGGLCVAAILLPGIWCWGQKQFRVNLGFVAAIPGTGFLVLTILELSGQLQSFNQQTTLWLETLRLPWLVELMSWLTWLGSWPVNLSLIAGCILAHYFRQQPVRVGLLVKGILLMEAMLWMAKLGVNSVRPGITQGFDSFSYPSGHTTLATFVLFFLAGKCTEKLGRKWQWGIYSTSLLLVWLVALSRMILNMHWLGDVLAGFCLGLFWLLMVYIFEERLRH